MMSLLFFMLGPVHTYRFRLKTEIFLPSLAYRAKMPGGTGGGEGGVEAGVTPLYKP